MTTEIARLEVQAAWELAKLQRAADRVRRAKRREQLAARQVAAAITFMELRRRGYTDANVALARGIARANPRFDRRIAATRCSA